MNQDNILNEMKKRMDGAISSLEKALSSMRTNRAHTGLVENIIVDHDNLVSYSELYSFLKRVVNAI